MTQAKEIKKIRIRAFETSKSMISCMSFWEGYSQVLVDESINYNQISSHNWLLSSSFHGILAEYEGEVIGGLLLFHPTKGNRTFPYKDTTKNTAANSPFEIETRENCAEIFALWHSNKAAGWGLTYLLLKAGLSLSTKLGFNKTLFLTANYNMRLVEKIGMEIVRSKGFEVYYNFKVEPFEIRAYLFFFDSDDLSYARNEKEVIKEIAEYDSLTKTEKVLGNTLEIEYVLN